MPEPSVQEIQDALRQAKDAGYFEGKVMTILQEIQRVLGEVNAKHTSLDTKVDNKIDKAHHENLILKVDTKADKLELEKMTLDVKALQRLVYIGLGILSAIEFIIVAVK
jgi:hypothetical protein